MKTLLLSLACLLILSCSNNSRHKSSSKQVITDSQINATMKNIDSAEYSVREFEVKGKLCFATINESFKNFPRKKEFPLSLWITVETKNRNVNGHPTDEEATLYNNLEDSLLHHLATRVPLCYIGRTTRDGYREVMFYVPDKAEAERAMNAFVNGNRFQRKITFTIGPDTLWESVSGFYQ